MSCQVASRIYGLSFGVSHILCWAQFGTDLYKQTRVHLKLNISSIFPINSNKVCALFGDDDFIDCRVVMLSWPVA